MHASVLAMLVAAGVPLGAISLDFEQTDYTVAPGDRIAISLQFSEPIPNGLDSYFIRLHFAEGRFGLTEEDIEVPEELDFRLFDPGAERSVWPDSAAVRGFTEFGSPYHGTAFATFTLTAGIDAASGEYPLTLSIPQANSFVDGEGNVIDDQILLGSASVRIAPPPPGLATPPAIDPVTGDVTLTFRGLAGRTYRIEASNDLVTWALLAEVTANAEAEIVYQDTDAAGSSRRFFRAVNR